jgi:integrase
MDQGADMAEPYRRKIILPSGKAGKAKTLTSNFVHNGVRVNRDTGCVTQAEYDKWEAAERARLDREASLHSSSGLRLLSVGNALARYYEEVIAPTGSDLVQVKSRLRNILRHIDANAMLADLSTADIKTYQVKRSKDRAKKGINKDGPGPATINREVRVIQAMHNHATEVWDLELKRIAWHRIKLVEPIVERPTISQATFRDLTASATRRLALKATFTVLTGLRRKEVERLTWQQVDLETTPPTILVRGKGKKEARIPISSTVASLLLSVPPQNSSLVFDSTNYKREWDAARRAIGALEKGPKHFRFHDLRHAFATWLEDMGAPIQGISKQLRHSDLATTLIYARAGNRTLLPYLERLGQEVLPSNDLLLSSTDGSNGTDEPSGGE